MTGRAVLSYLMFALLAVSPAMSQVNNTDAVTSQPNVKYGEAGGHELKLDVYLPPESVPATSVALVLVHGGGWSGGSKEAYRPDAQWFARKGYTCFAVGYRLVKGKTGQWPQQIDDVQMAVRWVRANAEKYGIDSNRICAIGGSAGGHLVALLGTMDTRDKSAPLAEYSSRPNCVIDWFGPTELSGDFPTSGPMGINVQKLIHDMIGNPHNAAAASPITHIDSQTVPFLVVHGNADQIVPADQSRQFVEALRKAGTEVEYIEVPGAGHGFAGKDREMVLGRMVEFLNKHLETKK